MTSPPAASKSPAADGEPAYIGAVVITFNPDPKRIREVVGAIAPQVDAVAIIDNGSAADPATYTGGAGTGTIHLFTLGDNYGIAAAQNIGLAWGRARGYTHVLLLDHDAVAQPGMVAALLTEMQGRQARGARVAAVGPLIHDPRRGAPAPFFRITKSWIARVDAPDPGEQSAQVDFLIAAGVLISMQALEEIGPMKEDWFIDYIDLEWSLRAASHGYRLYGHYGAQIDHRLGDEPMRVLGRTLMNHSPLRHYYLVRNALGMWRLPYAPRHWKYLDAFNLLCKFFIYSSLAPRRFAHGRMMLRGLADGLRMRYGRYDQVARDWRVPERVRSAAPRIL